MQSKRNIFDYRDIVSISWIAVAEILARIFKIAISVLFIRLLGSEQFGIYISAIALIAAFGFLLDFGLSITVMRELGQRAETKNLFLPIFSIKLLYIVSVACLLFILRPYVVNESLDKIFFHVLFWYILNEIVGTLFLLMRSVGVTQREAFARFFYSLYCVCSVMIFYSLDLISLKNLINSQIISIILFIVTFIVAYIGIFRKKNNILSFTSIISDTSFVLKRAYKFGVTNSAIVLFSALDMLLVSQFYSYGSVGNYAVALRILMVAQLPIAILIPAMYRMMFVNEEKSSLSEEKYYIIYGYSLFFSLCVAGFILVRSESLVILTAGGSYTDAVLLLQILSFGLPGYIMFPLFTQNLLMREKRNIVFLSYVSASLITVSSISFVGSFGFSVFYIAFLIAAIFNILALQLSLSCIMYSRNLFQIDRINLKLVFGFSVYFLALLIFSDETVLDIIFTAFSCIVIGSVTIMELKKRTTLQT